MVQYLFWFSFFTKEVRETVYKTEYIEFVNVKARSTSVVKAPNSDRAVEVKTTIAKIRFKNQQ